MQALENKNVMNPAAHIAVFHPYSGRRKMMLFSRNAVITIVLENA